MPPKPKNRNNFKRTILHDLKSFAILIKVYQNKTQRKERGNYSKKEGTSIIKVPWPNEKVLKSFPDSQIWQWQQRKATVVNFNYN